MNLKGRYNMLRQAVLAMVGVPDGDTGVLKCMAVSLAIPSLTDADAAMTRLVLQTLIATDDGEVKAAKEGVVHAGMPKAAFDCILHQLRVCYPLPNGPHKITMDVMARDDSYTVTSVAVHGGSHD